MYNYICQLLLNKAGEKEKKGKKERLGGRGDGNVCLGGRVARSLPGRPELAQGQPEHARQCILSANATTGQTQGWERGK